MDLLALGVVRPFLGYGPGLSDHPTRSPQRGGAQIRLELVLGPIIISRLNLANNANHARYSQSCPDSL